MKTLTCHDETVEIINEVARREGLTFTQAFDVLWSIAVGVYDQSKCTQKKLLVTSQDIDALVSQSREE